MGNLLPRISGSESGWLEHRGSSGDARRHAVDLLFQSVLSRNFDGPSLDPTCLVSHRDHAAAANDAFGLASSSDRCTSIATIATNGCPAKFPGQ